jgi:TolA-binding protein
MKNLVGDEMQRWRDRPTGGMAAEDRAAALIRGSLAPGEPSNVQLLQIEHALLERRRRPASWTLAVRVALVVVALTAGVATVKAYEFARRAGWLGSIQSAPRDPADRERASQRRARPARLAESGDAKLAPSEPVAEAASSAPPAALGAEAPPALVASARSPTRAASSAKPPHRSLAAPAAASAHVPVPPAEPFSAPSPATAPPPTAGSDLDPAAQLAPAPSPTPALPAASGPASRPRSSVSSEEIRTLDHALGLLRRDHDGAAALSALDAYLEGFPQGLLRQEARFARVDALLLLARSDEALVALEDLHLGVGRRATELRVIRGELRAPRDCVGAEADFSAALGQDPSAGLIERILYGRGVCRTRLGNVAGAAADLQRYLDRFPTGAHAPSARQWLRTLGKPVDP